MSDADGQITYKADADYIVDAYKGIIKRSAFGRIANRAAVNVSYCYLDASKVTLADAIGGVDEITGDYKGVYGLLAAQSTVKVTPRILCAPRFTHQRTIDDKRQSLANPVVAELTLRRPKTRDYLTAARSSAHAAEQEIRMICNLAEVSDKVIEELDWADYLKVQAALQNFSKAGAPQET